MQTTRTTTRMRLVTGLATAAVAALALAGCSSGATTSLSGAGGGGGGAATTGMTTLTIASVNVLDEMPVLYAQKQGYYTAAGLDVKLPTTDSGPAVITGVVNGTYDAAYAAWFPILIAISKGSPLTLVSAASVVKKGIGQGNSGLVVKDGSPITSYKDLVGKKVATNALTSLTTLSTQIRMTAEGADPSTVKFSSLPFKSAIQAVAQGQADAAVVVSPFQTEATLDGLKSIGDPINEAMPVGAPGLALFTSTKNATAKKAALQKFDAATLKASQELAANPALQRQIAQSVVGLGKEVAAMVPMPGFGTITIDLTGLQQQADLAQKYGYLGKPLTAKDIVVSW